VRVEHVTRSAQNENVFAFDCREPTAPQDARRETCRDKHTKKRRYRYVRKIKITAFDMQPQRGKRATRLVLYEQRDDAREQRCRLMARTFFFAAAAMSDLRDYVGADMARCRDEADAGAAARCDAMRYAMLPKPTPRRPLKRHAKERRDAASSEAAKMARQRRSRAA